MIKMKRGDREMTTRWINPDDAENRYRLAECKHCGLTRRIDDEIEEAPEECPRCGAVEKDE